MRNAKITVLLTVFNGMPYLPAAVKSILAQTEENFTFLILDDASTDGSGKYLDSLNDPRLRVIRLKDRLPRTAVLNKALAMVETEFTAIIDADDLARPDRLARQLDLLERQPEISLLGCDVEYIDKDGKKTGVERFPTDHDTLSARMPLLNQFAHSGCMYRTEHARQAGGYPSGLAYAQDMGLWLNLLKAGRKAASIPKILASIRVHPGRMSADAALKHARNTDAAELAKLMLELPDFPTASRQTARLRRALALFRLEEWREAVAETGRAFMEAPLLLPFNPLLWRFLAHTGMANIEKCHNKISK